MRRRAPGAAWPERSFLLSRLTGSGGEIAAASSVREVDHLWLEVRRDFAGDPRLRDLEVMLAAKRRLLAADEDAG
jgi:hypothetical protein